MYISVLDITIDSYKPFIKGVKVESSKLAAYIHTE
jgi:hypothetical protein